jgi:anti-anti-sigma factor
MEFTIEHKPTYATIHLSGNLDAAAAKALCNEIAQWKTTIAPRFIIDMKEVTQMDLEATSTLMELHEQVYEDEGSLVFVTLQEDVLQMMKKAQLHLSLNLCPTLIEGIDIISMELLERDLLNE